MKSIVLALLLTWKFAAAASTVIITVTGTVSFCDSDRFFTVPPVKVGDAWTLRAIYSYPTPPQSGVPGIYGYSPLSGRLEFETNGILWSGLLGGSAVIDISDHRGSFFSSQTVPAVLSPLGPASSTTARFWGNGSMITDVSSLPDSFAKWNLPAATSFDLDVGNLSVPGGAGWNIRADHFDTLTIQVIPEPTAAGLAGVVAIAALGRRRRMRA